MRKKMTFSTERKSKEKKKLIIIVAIISALLVMIAASVAIIINSSDATQNTEDAEYILPVKKNKITHNFLLWCKDTQGDLQFLWVVQAELPKGKYTIYSPSLDEQILYNEVYSSVADIYKKYGSEGLQTALEHHCDIIINSQIGSDGEHFKQVINYFGGVNVNVLDNIEYRGIFTLILLKGEMVLKGNSLYKYLLYSNFMQENASEARVQVLGELLTKVVSENYLPKLETIYSKIANLLISDITIVDFSASKDIYIQLFECGVKEVKFAKKASDF